MYFDAETLTKATAQLEQNREMRYRQAQEEKKIAYQRDPSLLEIDSNIRSAVPLLMSRFTKRGDSQISLEKIRADNLKLQQIRSDKLRKLGFSPDLLSDLPHCENCQDSGWVGSTLCHCLEHLCKQEQVRRLEASLPIGHRLFSHFNLDFYKGETPQTVEDMKLVFHICQQYAEDFGIQGSQFYRKSLLLHGTTGLGKTFLGSCIAYRVAQRGFSVIYTPAIALFDDFNKKQYPNFSEDNSEPLARVKSYLQSDLLFLDDLGSEATNSASIQSALYELINTRLATGKQTILTSNFLLPELSERYSAPVMSRIRGDYELLTCQGRDIRLQQKGF